MKKQFATYLLILSFFFFGGIKIASAETINCQGWTHPTETCPNIQSVSPGVLSIEDTVIITGSYFEQEQGLKKLSFWYEDSGNINGGRSTFDATGEIILWSDNEIKYKFNTKSWDAMLLGKNIRVCIKKCNDINGCDENCSNSLISIKPLCSSYVYSSWSSCSETGQQNRSIVSSAPNNCSIVTTMGSPVPVLNKTCTYIPACILDDWNCSDWGVCSFNGKQNRTCNKLSNCEGGTPSPATTQSCNYAPACSVDTWECGGWGTCSPQGVQTRTCNRTYDCPSAETAAPATSQYCVAPNQPQQQSPTEDLGIANQSTIIKSTVKLVCPVNNTTASQGSGTVIDSKGTILTNKHVIAGTSGCLVGFIDSYGDEPYFGDRQIADIYKISSDADVAILKLRNPTNKNLAFINISSGNSNLLSLGEKITAYGYPAMFGTKITYTSGDFSGVDGNYLKTTAIIEHGNSGGGAYLKNGIFIGIPSAVVKGSLNSMGYLLSVNKVNSWINGSSYAYNSGSNNNYSRVSSILENIDLNTLDSLNLFVADNGSTEQTKPIVSNTSVDKNLQNKLSGKILLQVQSHGEAWYVNPKDGKRYYMKDGAVAYQMMRNFGLGITNADLAKIPQEGDKNNNTAFVEKLKGKILLQVEAHGEAWYVDPKTGYKYYMKDGAAAYSLMRFHSLGITNSDLNKIPEGSL